MVSAYPTAYRPQSAPYNAPTYSDPLSKHRSSGRPRQFPANQNARLPRIGLPKPSTAVQAGADWALKRGLGLVRGGPLEKAVDVAMMYRQLSRSLHIGAVKLNNWKMPPGWFTFCATGHPPTSWSTGFSDLDILCQAAPTRTPANGHTATWTTWGQGNGWIRSFFPGRWAAEFHYDVQWVSLVDRYGPLSALRSWSAAEQWRIHNQAVPPRVPSRLAVGSVAYPQYSPWPYPFVDPETLPVNLPVNPPKRANRPQRARALNPYRAPAYQPQRGPHPKVRLGRIELPVTPTVSETVLEPSKAPRAQTAKERRVPPGKRTREVKHIASAAGIVTRVFGALTEFSDALHALRGALPKDKRGRPGSLQEEFAVVMRNWNYIDWKQALKNLLYEQIQDYLIGQVGRANRASARKLGRPVGPQAGGADAADLIFSNIRALGVDAPGGGDPIRSGVNRFVDGLFP
jgi:hypothetical protein